MEDHRRRAANIGTDLHNGTAALAAEQMDDPQRLRREHAHRPLADLLYKVRTGVIGISQARLDGAPHSGEALRVKGGGKGHGLLSPGLITHIAFIGANVRPLPLSTLSSHIFGP